MDLTRAHLREATAAGLLAEQQADQLWDFLSERQADRPSFRFTHILYYLGGLVAIGAMTLFMTLGWESFGGWGLFAIAAAYAVAALFLTELLLKRALPVPAGITATFALALVPLAVYGLQAAYGLWDDARVYREYHTHVDWRWIVMELATLLAGAVLVWRYRFPFLLMPVAVTLWYMSMDLTPALFGDQDSSWDLRKLVSLWFGLAVLLLAFWVDVRTRGRKDFAFWLYLFGVLAFWGGLSLLDSDGELARLGYLAVNLALIAAGAVLSRRVFVVFGGLGVALYLGSLAHGLFEDSLIFPFALTLIGLGIIGLGILWQRHEAALTRKLRSGLPPPLRELIENRS